MSGRASRRAPAVRANGACLPPRVGLSRSAAVVFATLLLAWAPGAAEPASPATDLVPPGVLILHSNQRPTAAGVVIEDTLRTVVPEGLRRPVGLYSEYLDEEWTSVKTYGE